MKYYEGIVECFKLFKADGIPRDEAEDYLEFDSDQYPTPEEIKAALIAVYGEV